MVARDKLNASKVEEEVERKKKVSTRFDIHTKCVGMRACVHAWIAATPCWPHTYFKEILRKYWNKMRSESIPNFFSTSRSLCVCVCVSRSTEQRKTKRMEIEKNSATSFLLSSVTIDLKQCDIYTSHGYAHVCVYACFVTNQQRMNRMNADVNGNGKIGGIVLLHSTFFETKYENWMGVNAIMCVCYDSIELHLCKILMRYNCFKIREKKLRHSIQLILFHFALFLVLILIRVLLFHWMWNVIW